MANPDEIAFARLADGTLLQRHPDGSFRPVASRSDRARIAALTDAEIEDMAASDPDHAPLDDAFWDGAGPQAAAEEGVSITLDGDVVRYFREAGLGYQTRINAVLRRYMRANKTG